MPPEPATPVMDAAYRGTAADLQRLLQRGIPAQFGMPAYCTAADAAGWVDVPDDNMQLTPLMICAFRGAEGVDIARILLRAGAGVETADSSPSQSRPLFMAAQQGNTELVQLLLEHSARLDVTSPGSTTTPIWIAAQNGHAPTLARLLEGAQRASLLTPLIDATNRQSKTPANIAIELGHADVIGVLARCGADLRRASPAFYGLRDSEAQRVDHFTVTPSSPGHFALDAAARSFAAKQCCHCGAPVPGSSRCSRCALAYYCGRECQLANWPSHKGVCPKLRRGASLVSPDVIPAVAEPPWASLPPFGFDEAFGAADEASDIHHSQYSRDTSAVWEYDAGGARSQPEWRRYPARIEGALESMCMRVPEGEKFMYRPNHPDNDGMYEAHNRSGQPPPGVATRFVIFADMTEREVYTGASRAVRRNGRRANPAEDDGENGVLDLID